MAVRSPAAPPPAPTTTAAAAAATQQPKPRARTNNNRRRRRNSRSHARAPTTTAAAAATAARRPAPLPPLSRPPHRHRYLGVGVSVPERGDYHRPLLAAAAIDVVVEAVGRPGGARPGMRILDEPGDGWSPSPCIPEAPEPPRVADFYDRQASILVTRNATLRRSGQAPDRFTLIANVTYLFELHLRGWPTSPRSPAHRHLPIR